MHKNKLLLWMLAVLVVFGAIHPAVKADTAELSVSASSGEVEVGDWVEVTLSFSSNEKLAGVYARITYDQGLLEYTGGDAEGDTGSLTISRMEEAAQNVLTYTLYFSAKAEGTAVISVTESGMYDEQANSIGSPTADVTVVIRKGASLSSDASLKSLLTSYGRLEPDFRSDIFEYSMTVPYEITTLTLTAAASDATAAVQVSGLAELAVGENRRSVRVMAPDGTTSLYTIVITREEEKQESGAETSGAEENSETSGEEADTPSFKVAGKTMYWQDIPDEQALPEGFLKTTYHYSGYTYEVATVADGSLILMYLTDFRGENGALYLFNAEFGTCRRAVPVNMDGTPLVLLNADEGEFPTEGAALQNVEIGGYPLRAYVFPEYPAEYTVYSSQGRFLTYHVDTEVLEEYKEKPKPEESSKEEESSAASAASKPEETSETSRAEESRSGSSSSGSSSTLARLLARFSGLVKYLPYILYALIAFALIIVVLLVVVVAGGRGRRSRTAREYDKVTAVPVEEQAVLPKAGSEPAEEEIPERPEDVALDQDAFEHWKEATMTAPLPPMTEVHHTTFEAVTGNLPKVKEETREQAVNLSENAAEAAKAAAAVVEGEKKKQEEDLASILPKSEADTEEPASEELSPEDFFE